MDRESVTWLTGQVEADERPVSDQHDDAIIQTLHRV